MQQQKNLIIIRLIGPICTSKGFEFTLFPTIKLRKSWDGGDSFYFGNSYHQLWIDVTIAKLLWYEPSWTQTKAYHIDNIKHDLNLVICVPNHPKTEEASTFVKFIKKHYIGDSIWFWSIKHIKWQLSDNIYAGHHALISYQWGKQNINRLFASEICKVKTQIKV